MPKPHLPRVPCPPARGPLALWIVVWDATSAADLDTPLVPAGLPVRVLLDGTARLPEHVFLDCPDLKTACVRGPRAAFHQVRAWLEELADV
jgi:hypothetical protein